MSKIYILAKSRSFLTASASILQVYKKLDWRNCEEAGHSVVVRQWSIKSLLTFSGYRAQ